MNFNNLFSFLELLLTIYTRVNQKAQTQFTIRKGFIGCSLLSFISAHCNDIKQSPAYCWLQYRTFSNEWHYFETATRPCLLQPRWQRYEIHVWTPLSPDKIDYFEHMKQFDWKFYLNCSFIIWNLKKSGVFINFYEPLILLNLG